MPDPTFAQLEKAASLGLPVTLTAAEAMSLARRALDDAWHDDNDPGEIMIDGSWVDTARALLGGPYDDDDAALSAAGTPAGRGER